MEFHLNQEELGVLKAIRDLNDSGKKTDYYQVVEASRGDTGILVPVVGRLDDEGYITSSGAIRRYCHITEKGRKTLAENGLG